MSYERRGLRPFETMDATQKSLNSLLKVQSPPIPSGYVPPLGSQALKPLGLEPGAGSIAGANGTLILDADQYTTNAIGLYFGINDDDWRELLRVVDKDLSALFGKSRLAPVSVLVTATNSRLRQVAELIREPYEEFARSDTWRRLIVRAGDNDARPRPFRMPDDGCAITVQFVIDEDVPAANRKPGMPWRKGTWLARWRIRVTATRGSGLAPRFLTDEARQRFGVGSRSSIYVHFPAGYEDLSKATDLGDLVSVYIDQSALEKASELKPNGELATPGGEAMMVHWVMDTYRSLVAAIRMDDSLQEFDTDDEESRQSYLYSLLQQVSDHGGLSIDEAFNVLKDQPERFIALIEHSLDRLKFDQHLLQLRKA
jgi:hypothetical protein